MIQSDICGLGMDRLSPIGCRFRHHQAKPKNRARLMLRHLNILRLRTLVWIGERIEGRVLVGDEGCIWAVEFWRHDLERAINR